MLCAMHGKINTTSGVGFRSDLTIGSTRKTKSHVE